MIKNRLRYNIGTNKSNRKEKESYVTKELCI